MFMNYTPGLVVSVESWMARVSVARGWIREVPERQAVQVSGSDSNSERCVIVHIFRKMKRREP